MDSTRLPPETPRRQLLKRIHRRSSILPSMDPASHLAPSASASTTRSSSRRTSLNPDSASSLLGNAALEKHDEAEEDYEQTGYDHDEATAPRAQSSTYGQAHESSAYDADNYDHDDDDEDGRDENGEEAAWAQVDELMDTVQLKNQRILELEKSLSQLQRDLQIEKERTKPSKGSSTSGTEKGLTRAAAVKLEREFLSQEMILKGLQRDNEDKTLEVEALRRKVKIMSDFLARQYGPDDWEAVVAASSGGVVSSSGAKEAASAPSPEKESLSAVARVLGAAHAGSPRAPNRAKFTPVLGGETSLNPFSPAAASPTKTLGAINNDDVLIPTIARLQTPASSPSKLFVSSFAPRRTSMDHADTSIDVDTPELEQQHQDAVETTLPSPLVVPDALEGKTSTPGALPAGLDPNVLLASIESVRLLIQGFERKNAMRRAELESVIDKAIEAERRAERLHAGAAASSLEATPITAS